MRAWTHAGRIPAGAWRPWLFVTARHLVIDTARSRRSRPVEVGPALIEVAVQDDGLDAALDAVLLADALAALSAEHRQVLFDCLLPRPDRPRRSRTLAACLRAPSGRGCTTRSGRCAWPCRSGG